MSNQTTPATPQKLQDEVAKKFDLKQGSPLVGFFGGFGERDLTKITLKEAEELHKEGFRWLLPKETKEVAEDKKKQA